VKPLPPPVIPLVQAPCSWQVTKRRQKRLLLLRWQTAHPAVPAMRLRRPPFPVESPLQGGIEVGPGAIGTIWLGALRPGCLSRILTFGRRSGGLIRLHLFSAKRHRYANMYEAVSSASPHWHIGEGKSGTLSQFRNDASPLSPYLRHDGAFGLPKPCMDLWDVLRCLLALLAFLLLRKMRFRYIRPIYHQQPCHSKHICRNHGRGARSYNHPW